MIATPFKSLLILLLFPAFITGTAVNLAALPKQRIDAELQRAIQSAPAASKYPHCACVKLLDTGDITLKADGTQIATYRETYLLYNRAARDYGEVVLPYDADYQQIRLIKAQTVEPDGRVRTLSPSEVKLGGQAGEFALYSDAMALMFSMPGIENGSIIDYRYQVISHPDIMQGRYSLYWSFNSTVPVVLSRLTLRCSSTDQPACKILNAKGTELSEKRNTNGSQTSVAWEMHNIPRIKIEPAMPLSPQIRVAVEISTIPSWTSIGDWYYHLEQPAFKPYTALVNLVKTITKGCTTQRQSAEALYTWTATHIRYVGLEFGLSAYQPHKPSMVLKNLYGDCKDKATLLIAMLRIAGIRADAAMLESGDNLPIEQNLPSLTSFDHVVVTALVGGKVVWMDPTASFCSYGDIPTSDRGAEALVIGKTDSKFETVPNYTAGANGSDITVSEDVKPDMSASVEVTAIFQGDVEQELQATLLQTPEGDLKQVVQNLASNLGLSGTVQKFVISRNTPLTFHITLKVEHIGTSVSNLQLLPIFNSMSGPGESNPYTENKRVWPIVSAQSSHLTTTTTVNLPSGWKFTGVPDAVNYSDPLQTYQCSCVLSNSVSTLTERDIYRQEAGESKPENYSLFQRFWTALLKVQGLTCVVQRG